MVGIERHTSGDVQSQDIKPNIKPTWQAATQPAHPQLWTIGSYHVAAGDDRAVLASQWVTEKEKLAKSHKQNVEGIEQRFEEATKALQAKLEAAERKYQSLVHLVTRCCEASPIPLTWNEVNEKLVSLETLLSHGRLVAASERVTEPRGAMQESRKRKAANSDDGVENSVEECATKKHQTPAVSQDRSAGRPSLLAQGPGGKMRSVAKPVKGLASQKSGQLDMYDEVQSRRQTVSSMKARPPKKPVPLFRSVTLL